MAAYCAYFRDRDTHTHPLQPHDGTAVQGDRHADDSTTLSVPATTACEVDCETRRERRSPRDGMKAGFSVRAVELMLCPQAARTNLRAGHVPHPPKDGERRRNVVLVPQTRSSTPVLPGCVLRTHRRQTTLKRRVITSVLREANELCAQMLMQATGMYTPRNRTAVQADDSTTFDSLTRTRVPQGRTAVGAIVMPNHRRRCVRWTARRDGNDVSSVSPYDISRAGHEPHPSRRRLARLCGKCARREPETFSDGLDDGLPTRTQQDEWVPQSTDAADRGAKSCLSRAASKSSPGSSRDALTAQAETAVNARTTASPEVNETSRATRSCERRCWIFLEHGWTDERVGLCPGCRVL